MFQHGKSLCLATLLPIATACFFFKSQNSFLTFPCTPNITQNTTHKKKGLE
ncbi:hypothetical protein BDL97_06G040500 [Sphagnum fallax]|nr:hypothetical protein BDL97_06G040500 [Sphagnum fallax]